MTRIVALAAALFLALTGSAFAQWASQAGPGPIPACTTACAMNSLALGGALPGGYVFGVIGNTSLSNGNNIFDSSGNAKLAAADFYFPANGGYGRAWAGGGWGIANTNDPTSSADVILTRKGPANWQIGAADVATALAQTLSVQGVVAGTSNVGGANFTIQGSQGTGTGLGGSLIFQVSPHGTTGTAQNPFATALTIDETKLATFAGAVSVTGHATLEGVTSTGATGTGNIVFSASPTLITPAIGVATGTSIALGGATIGTNALAITGSSNISGNSTFGAQIIVANMTQTPSAQTGTVCWSAGGLTYDATLGCLASDERLKDILGPDTGALDRVMRLKPIVYDWKSDAPKAAVDPGDHIGLGAFATAYVDERLIARDPEGNPRAWREDAEIADLVAAIQELNSCHLRVMGSCWF